MPRDKCAAIPAVKPACSSLVSPEAVAALLGRARQACREFIANAIEEESVKKMSIRKAGPIRLTGSCYYPCTSAA